MRYHVRDIVNLICGQLFHPAQACEPEPEPLPPEPPERPEPEPLPPVPPEPPEPLPPEPPERPEKPDVSYIDQADSAPLEIARPTPGLLQRNCQPPVPGSFDWMASHLWLPTQQGLRCQDCDQVWPEPRLDYMREPTIFGRS